MTSLSSCLGFPRIGVTRELKFALESYWSHKISATELEAKAKAIRVGNWQTLKDAGIDHIPSGDFSLYDHILDTAVAVGAVPERFQIIEDEHTRYFALARGLQDKALGIDVSALELTKWFDTNYHYIVPEIHETQPFRLNATKILTEIADAKALGITVRPVIPGPVTFLKLSKARVDASRHFKPLDRLGDLLTVYEELLTTIAKQGIEWVQIDEPCLVLDLDECTARAYKTAFHRLSRSEHRPKLLLATYFGSLGSNLNLAASSGFDGIHLDLVRAPDQLAAVLKAIDAKTTLSLGVVDGRNIWRTDLDYAHGLVRKAVETLGATRVIVSSSCSLLHVPVDLRTEVTLDAELKSWLAFATQKLTEVRSLANAAGLKKGDDAVFKENRSALETRRLCPLTSDPAVRSRVEDLTVKARYRAPYAERFTRQQARFKLPILPSTTIGSFPQTAEVRSARASWQAGRLTTESYNEFLRQEIKTCIKRQEDLGLDVLVHGEFERNDMVEYFGQKLSGFGFTEFGWVQSFGSRCVKPPFIYGDVSRPQPITVEWSAYAQSLTERPVKGMLTGPVTILHWSFVRDDQPKSTTCLQIALAIRDEVNELEKAGISIIQVDEPAVREGLPLREADWKGYLDWAVDAFRVATSGVRTDTQIHTHMCYSEFGNILDGIAAMDADVISIETSRSQLDLLKDFRAFKYPNGVGPGVYDIHSARVPSENEIESLLIQARSVLPIDRIWVNPDCGLKTRGWPEVESALKNMVAATKKVREGLKELRL